MESGSVWLELRALTREQKSAVAASFLGWTLDAFDFFIMTLVMVDVAKDFGTSVTKVAFGITLTLAMRPIGAFVFGILADRFGRRPILMIDILLFSAFEGASAFAPNLITFLILRALFGIAMGGEWGIGSSLAMETIPPRVRGIVSGFLQEGYAFGNLLSALAFGTIYGLVGGWRGMFLVGVVPALLVVYIRASVKESPVWESREASTSSIFRSIGAHWKLFLYIILVMSCFNAFSHGTQDLYKTFLDVQHHLSRPTISTMIIIANIGAICGGISFGMFSEKIGRRRAIIIAAVLALPVIPLWAFSTTPLMLGLGAFLMQFMVQGAWGVVPVHLNELSPDEVRGTFPGFTYQLGNFIISLAAPFQAWIAHSNGDNYGIALASVAGGVALLLIPVIGLGMEKKGVVFGKARLGAT